MPRALRPAAPADELASAGKDRGEKKRGILTAELAAFCESGISIVVASRTAGGRPIGGQALACAVHASGRVRLVLGMPVNRTFIEAIGNGGGIAATFTRPENHRSIQLKASAARIVAFQSADLQSLAAQCDNLRRELVSVDYTEEFAAAYCSWREADLGAVEFLPEQVFVQTPGPGAGSALRS